MRYLPVLLLLMLATTSTAVCQNSTIDSAATGVAPSQKFAYKGKSVNHYSLGWFFEESQSSGAFGYLSAYPGIRFFTQGTPRMFLNGAGYLGLGTMVPTHPLTFGSSSSDVVFYKTTDQVANYERLRQFWSGDTFTFAAEKAGTGSYRTIRFDNNNMIFDVGQGGAVVSTKTITKLTNGLTVNYKVDGTAGEQNFLSVMPTIAQTGTAGYRGIWISPYDSLPGISSGVKYLIDAGTRSGKALSTHIPKFTVDSAGFANVASRMLIGAIAQPPTASLQVAANNYTTDLSYSTNGFGFQVSPATYKSKTSTGTIVATGISTFGTPTLTANNATTLNSAATVYIAGAPVGSTNLTIERPIALHVAGGRSVFNGNVGIGTKDPVSRLTLAGTNTISPNMGNELDYVGLSLTFQNLSTSTNYTLGGIKMVQPKTYFIDAADMVFSTRLGGTDITEKMRVKANGYVGVGTSDPRSRFQVGSKTGRVNLGDAGGPALNYGTSYIGFNANRNSSTSQWEFETDSANNGGAVIWGDILGGINFATIGSTGTGGPGALSRTLTDADIYSNATMRLTKDGLVRAKDFKVSLSVWSDYVFYKNYQLPKLTDVATYIQKNQHLPEVPSEKEVIKDGVQLGEMNRLLLKKVEELTLYLIDQNKRILKLERQLPKKKRHKAI